MIKAVLFDLDGTLLNRDRSVELFISKQYDRMYKSLYHISKENYISRFIELDNRGYVWKDIVYQQLTAEFSIHSVTWERLLQDYLDNFKHHCVAFPHIHDMLKELKSNDMALGIITNGYGKFQMDNIKALNIEKYFDIIFVSEWEGIKKPDAQIFLRALEKLKVEPSESVYIGDHPENDVRAAKNVGMKSVWKKDNQWSDVEADAIIEDYLQLPLIMKSLAIEDV